MSSGAEARSARAGSTASVAQRDDVALLRIAALEVRPGELRDIREGSNPASLAAKENIAALRTSGHCDNAVVERGLLLRAADVPVSVLHECDVTHCPAVERLRLAPGHGVLRQVTLVGPRLGQRKRLLNGRRVGVVVGKAVAGHPRVRGPVALVTGLTGERDRYVILARGGDLSERRRHLVEGRRWLHTGGPDRMSWLYQSATRLT